jgi:hypothetical protein
VPETLDEIKEFTEQNGCCKVVIVFDSKPRCQIFWGSTQAGCIDRGIHLLESEGIKNF